MTFRQKLNNVFLCRKLQYILLTDVILKKLYLCPYNNHRKSLD